jgi:hypothetical protein
MLVVAVAHRAILFMVDLVAVALVVHTALGR